MDDEADWDGAELEGIPELTVDAAAGMPGMPAMPPSLAQQPGPGPQQQQLDPSVYKNWLCIYPCYINPKKKVCEGRRLPLDLVIGCELVTIIVLL
jgi:hypothetical protein